MLLSADAVVSSSPSSSGCSFHFSTALQSSLLSEPSSSTECISESADKSRIEPPPPTLCGPRARLDRADKGGDITTMGLGLALGTATSSGLSPGTWPCHLRSGNGCCGPWQVPCGTAFDPEAIETTDIGLRRSPSSNMLPNASDSRSRCSLLRAIQRSSIAASMDKALTLLLLLSLLLLQRQTSLGPWPRLQRD